MAVIEKYGKRNGFSLVELLVVIGIIAMLLGILLPSLNIARGQAKRIYCLSNLRQMGIASANYCSNNSGYFPIAQWSTQEGDDFYSYCWDFTVVNGADGKRHEPGLLWEGDTIEQVQQCPSYEGSDNWADIRYTGYNYNTSYVGHGQNEAVSNDYKGRVIAHPKWGQYYKIVMPVRAGQIKRPGECALFGDGQYAGGANKFMRSPFAWAGDKDNSARSAGTQGYRHLGKTNIVWADGHAVSQSRIFTKSAQGITDEIKRYNRLNSDKEIGFISEDNRAYDLN